MKTSTTAPIRSFLGLVLVLGGLPALIILALVRFENSEIIVMQQNMGPYSLGQLLAGVLSPSAPILLLIPLAITWMSPPKMTHFFALTWLTPLIFLFPTLLAASIVGAPLSPHPFFAVTLIALFITCFCVWLRVLDHFLPKPFLLLLYGAFWAGSSFLDYVVRYVLPHQEGFAPQGLSALTWTLPQLGTLLSTIDEYLQGNGWAWKSIVPTLLQLPILLCILFFLKKRSHPSET